MSEFYLISSAFVLVIELHNLYTRLEKDGTDVFLSGSGIQDILISSLMLANFPFTATDISKLHFKAKIYKDFFR